LIPTKNLIKVPTFFACVSKTASSLRTLNINPKATKKTTGLDLGLAFVGAQAL